MIIVRLYQKTANKETKENKWERTWKSGIDEAIHIYNLKEFQIESKQNSREEIYKVILKN